MPASREPEATVVVPVYRNADTLEELHRRLVRVFEARGMEFEIVFVDDACPAGSLDVLRRLAQCDPRVAAVALGRNVGQHRAVLAGLSLARGRWKVVLDADLQDPPEAIPGLIEKGEGGFGAVFAGRRGRYESAGRLVTSRLFKRLLSLLCGARNGLAGAGLFVALDRAMTARILSMVNGPPFVIAMIGCAGLPIASVPVERSPRPRGESAYGSWGRLKSGLRGVAWAVRWRLGLRGAPDRERAVIAERIGERFRAAETMPASLGVGSAR